MPTLEAVNFKGITLSRPAGSPFSRMRLTDSSAVLFSEGIVDTAGLARRTRRLDVSESRSNHHTPGGGPRDVPQGIFLYRRRLQSTSTLAMTTVTISNTQFNAHGSLSSAAEAGVTSITVTKTSDGEVRSYVPAVNMGVRSKREGLSSPRRSVSARLFRIMPAESWRRAKNLDIHVDLYAPKHFRTD